ncbi:MAG: hypothetical protein DRG09_05545 [Epsilonproteobacteria bacterium]|nr:MAG: hypothetical protein DRG09_05545 [Campylobacterota bacterium]
MLYMWIVTIGLQTFVLPDKRPIELPEDVIGLMFVLYGLLAVSVLMGTLVSTMINNKYYMKFFSIIAIVGLATLLTTKSMFG